MVTNIYAKAVVQPWKQKLTLSRTMVIEGGEVWTTMLFQDCRKQIVRVNGLLQFLSLTLPALGLAGMGTAAGMVASVVSRLSCARLGAHMSLIARHSTNSALFCSSPVDYEAALIEV